MSDVKSNINSRIEYKIGDIKNSFILPVQNRLLLFGNKNGDDSVLDNIYTVYLSDTEEPCRLELSSNIPERMKKPEAIVYRNAIYLMDSVDPSNIYHTSALSGNINYWIRSELIKPSTKSKLLVVDDKLVLITFSSYDGVGITRIYVSDYINELGTVTWKYVRKEHLDMLSIPNSVYSHKGSVYFIQSEGFSSSLYSNLYECSIRNSAKVRLVQTLKGDFTNSRVVKVRDSVLLILNITAPSIFNGVSTINSGVVCQVAITDKGLLVEIVKPTRLKRSCGLVSNMAVLGNRTFSLEEDDYEETETTSNSLEVSLSSSSFCN